MDVRFLVLFHDEFYAEFAELPEAVQDGVLAQVVRLAEFGPRLRRPHADTLKGSRHANMKELRFKAAGGVWRVTYAFDPKRQAILLVAGDKSGTSAVRFYRQLIDKSDARYDAHLSGLKDD